MSTRLTVECDGIARVYFYDGSSRAALVNAIKDAADEILKIRAMKVRKFN